MIGKIKKHWGFITTSSLICLGLNVQGIECWAKTCPKEGRVWCTSNITKKKVGEDFKLPCVIEEGRASGHKYCVVQDWGPYGVMCMQKMPHVCKTSEDCTITFEAKETCAWIE